MKRIVVLALCIIMVISMVCISNAELDNGTKLVIDMLKYYQYETEQITLAVKDQQAEWEKYLGNDVDTIDFALMYQVYYLDMKDIVAAYDDDGSFGANITNRYYWVVPNYEKGCEVQVVRNDQSEHGWAIRRGTSFMRAMKFNHPEVGFGIGMMYENALNTYPDTDRDSFRVVYDEDNDMHLLYFACKGEEYVVPYFTSEEITWISNEEVYAVSDFIELMRINIIEGSALAQIPNKAAPETIYFSYVLIGSALVVCIAVVAIVIASKMKRKQDK